MAVTATHLTTGSDTTNGLTYTTASINPTAGRLILVAVLATVGSGTTDVTLSGCGLNWVRVAQTPAAARTVHVFRAMGTPTTGPVTITGASAMTSALWQAVEFNGVDTSGADGSGAIAQSVTARPGSSTLIGVPFPGVVDSANGAYAAVGVAVQEAPVAGGAPWAALGSTAQSAPTSGLLAEFASPASQEITASWTTAAASFVVGAEIKAAAADDDPTGAASGSLEFVGEAVGASDPIGTATGTLAFIGTAVGGNAPTGAAVGTLEFAGAAVGESERSGGATGLLAFTGSAVGSRANEGVATPGSLAFVGAAVGFAPVVIDVGTSHTYGFATLTSAPIGAATLAAVPLATVALVGTPVSSTSLGGFGLDFGLNFGLVTVTQAATFSAATGISEATLKDTTGRAALQT